MGGARVLMYSSDWCPYCQRARRLLDARGVAYEEIDVDVMPGAREEMVARSGRDTVPQIFIGERHVGGSDELQALQENGELDTLLK